MDIFPDAEVRATQVDDRPIQVKISSGDQEIITVAQRELFGKYGWPAEKPIKAALNKFKGEEA
eukprot:CAMPEP_0115839010 /NCGR_PEP_ID=MMETSP0287-20121206/6033_1 /TAXON_ID=412157 /ORGANISM="Chrysochromulina rotalis, Strain UIO044" /LENGTH=62 /DNA_ID=CAMNT_0003292573 /DNA_START=210 /DNA_END=398 /DNA_ORIENTATION=-